MWAAADPADELRQRKADEDGAADDTTNGHGREPVGLLSGWRVSDAPDADADTYDANGGRPGDRDQQPSI